MAIVFDPTLVGTFPAMSHNLTVLSRPEVTTRSRARTLYETEEEMEKRKRRYQPLVSTRYTAALRSLTQHYTALHSITQPYTALHSLTQPYTAAYTAAYTALIPLKQPITVLKQPITVPVRDRGARLRVSLHCEQRLVQFSCVE